MGRTKFLKGGSFEKKRCSNKPLPKKRKRREKTEELRSGKKKVPKAAPVKRAGSREKRKKRPWSHAKNEELERAGRAAGEKENTLLGGV